jgi:glycerol-3-phosphate dehydrogenase
MKRILAALADGTFDVLILGGGITGAGVALDATLRGLRVALIDKGDFASGTSSVSSKLVHGGLRYLEHGDWRLVGEALYERRLLLSNAPHLVNPLRFIVPYYRGARVAPWQWRAGLMLYDLLAGASNIRRSRPLDCAALRSEFPALQTDGLKGGAAYFDAQMDDARLCLEVIQTAARHGASVANYVEAIAFEAGGVRARDNLGGSEFPICARQVLNATGPWVDAVCRLAGDTNGPHLQPTKGVHVILPSFDLPAALLLLHPSDERVFFVIPWLGKTLVGTTDTTTGAGPDALAVQPEDIEYLLAGVQRYFPSVAREESILGSFAGLRPLVTSRAGLPSARSREFRLIESPCGLLSAAGGKYTTYRRMAEVTTDEIIRRLKLRRRCRTHQIPLDGTPRQPWPEFMDPAVARLRQRHSLAETSARHLVLRYGRRAEAVAEYLNKYPSRALPIVAGEPDLQVEIVYQAEHEMAQSRADHFLRRMRLGWFRPELLAVDDAGGGMAAWGGSSVAVRPRSRMPT